jgi:fructose-1,6-bisphosphatase II
MLKIAAGAEAKGILDIRQSPTENLKRLASAKKCRVADLTAIVLDRPRHKELIEEIRAAGARIYLIGDGDVSAAIATATPNTGIDILFGIGGAPEGVISAAALQCLGGEFQGILKPRNPGEIERALKMGIDDINRVFKIDELAKGNLMFCATGVTQGNFLDGVIFKPWGCTTHSLVMRSESGTIRHIRAEHHFDKKPRY